MQKQAGTCPNVLGYLNLPDPTPQQHTAAILGIKLSLNELERLWKESVMDYLRVVSCYPPTKLRKTAYNYVSNGWQTVSNNLIHSLSNECDFFNAYSSYCTKAYSSMQKLHTYNYS
jgi:hypothetical protein